MLNEAHSLPKTEELNRF